MARRLSRIEAERLFAEQAIRRRAQRTWARVKAVLNVVRLFVRVKRQARSMELMKLFMKQLGEWARMKHAMKKMIKSVILMQSTARTFLKLKRSRCEVMNREWLRAEEAWLTPYFKMYSRKLMEEHAEERNAMPGDKKRTGHRRARQINVIERQKEAEFAKQMAGDAKGGKMMIDWKEYRIPHKERHIAISRHYMSMLRRQVRAQRTMLMAINAAIESEKELAAFLRTMGAEQSLGKVEVSPAAVENHERLGAKRFYDLSEEDAVRLITVSAQALINVEPFYEHPANREQHGVARPKKFGDRKPAAGQAALRLNGSGGGDAEEEDEVDTSRADIEDVFQSFSPRIRKIVEEQSTQSRVDAKNKTVPDADVAGPAVADFVGEGAMKGQAPDAAQAIVSRG